MNKKGVFLMFENNFFTFRLQSYEIFSKFASEISINLSEKNNGRKKIMVTDVTFL